MSEEKVRPFALVVEDDTKLATIFSQALDMAGYEVDVISDGAVASTRLATETPALVVVDLHLPGVMGNELLAQIRADARLKETRVLLATADQRLAETLRRDADMVLLKPVSFSQLRLLASRFLPSDAG